MGRKLRIWNQITYEKYLKDGRGQGKGIDYLPWIQVQDFPSQGIISRVVGCKTGRIHHFMSSLEKNYFYLLDCADMIVDIREQYPLSDLERAINIAQRAGIKYPKDAVSEFPYVLTCDFMVTTNSGIKARTIKLSSELNNRRTKEKLEIERRYWRDVEIDWKLVTERDISLQKVRNIEWLYTPSTLPKDLEIEKIQADMLYQLEKKRNVAFNSVINIATEIDNKYNLESGSGLLLFKHLVKTRSVSIDIYRTMSIDDRYSQRNLI